MTCRWGICAYDPQVFARPDTLEYHQRTQHEDEWKRSKLSKKAKCKPSGTKASKKLTAGQKPPKPTVVSNEEHCERELEGDGAGRSDDESTSSSSLPK